MFLARPFLVSLFRRVSTLLRVISAQTRKEIPTREARHAIADFEFGARPSVRPSEAVLRTLKFYGSTVVRDNEERVSK